jgi:uncharacterized membrane protein YjgN (DUF898 family)
MLDLPRDGRARLRSGLLAWGVTLVTVGAVYLTVTGGGLVSPALLSVYDDAHHSVQCEACIHRIHDLHDTEHDALTSEVSDCKRIEANCAMACREGDKDCVRE